ncbi:MAG: hypothetical protein AAGC55_18000, partial [Myxococcota bacterium]
MSTSVCPGPTRLVPALVLAITLALLGGCAGPTSAVDTMRFKNQMPVWKVNDRKDVPNKPAEHPFPEILYFFDAFFYDRVDYLMAVDEPIRAMSANALGEVPDSTWFTNRIGGRLDGTELSIAEIQRGPNNFASPDMTQKLTVTSSKPGGGSAGFIIEDARGDKYIIKFDEPHAPVTESATDVAV